MLFYLFDAPVLQFKIRRLSCVQVRFPVEMEMDMVVQISVLGAGSIICALFHPDDLHFIIEPL